VGRNGYAFQGMGRFCKFSLPALAAAVVAGGLLACGGGGASTTTVTSSAASVSPATPSASTPTAAAPHTTATRTATTAASGPALRPVLHASTTGHLSAAAKSFLVKGGDNSIPEYGQEAGASERARAEATLATFLGARAHGEWSRVCDELTAATRGQLERLVKAAKGRAGAISGCGGVLAALSRGPAATRANPLAGGVVALRVKGAVAFALFRGPHATKYMMPMRNEGGAWKVSQITPLPYPLGAPGVNP
jgi:hypothetical protein